MKLFKYIIFFQITSVLFAALFMLTSFLLDLILNQFFRLFGQNEAFEFFITALGIIEWLLFMPFVVCLSHITSKGIAFSNLSFGEAIKETINKVRDFMKGLVLKFQKTKAR